MTLAPATGSTFKFTPTAIICLALGGLTLLAYYLLTFVTQTELGATTLPTLINSRSNNEVGLTTNGLALIPFAGWLSIFAGLWNLSNTQVSARGGGGDGAGGGVDFRIFRRLRPRLPR